MEGKIEINENIECINKVLEIVKNTFSNYNNELISKEEFKHIMYDSVGALNVLIADMSYAADLEPEVLQEKLKEIASKVPIGNMKEIAKESAEKEMKCKFISIGNA